MTYLRWGRVRMWSGPTYTVEVTRNWLSRTFSCTVISNDGHPWDHRLATFKRAHDALAYVKAWTAR